ncbi:MAG: helix-turn-helix domain-containing protein [Methylovirgula sp.]
MEGLLNMSNRGARLIEAMRLRGMQKQHALAHTLGVNESTVTRWKNNGPMSLDRAIALCDLLDISLDWFLAGYGSMERHIKNDLHDHADMTAEEIDGELFCALKRLEKTMSRPSKVLLIAFLNATLPR